MRINNRAKRQYFSELEQSCRIDLAKRTTFLQRRKAVNYFIGFLNTYNINLRHLESEHLHDFLQFLSQKRTSGGKKFAPATIKQIYALTKSFYVRLYEKTPKLRHPDRIFIRGLLQKYKLGERKLPKYVDQIKMKNLLNECPDEWKALLHLMYDTGARVSEVLNLQNQHLDLKRRTIQIYEPKTMNVRVTTLSKKTTLLLDEYFSEHRPSPREKYSSYVFISLQKRRLSVRTVQYAVKRISRMILGEEEAITPHYFRAACAAHLLESGVDIRQVQEIIGWKSLSVVQNYTRVTPQRQAQLKEDHHPGFQETLDNQDREKKGSATSRQLEALQHQMDKIQQQNQQEFKELKRAFQNERTQREQDRQKYEKQIKDLMETIQILAQKSK